MDPGIVGQAAGMFVVTNVDDLLILALFFGQAAGDRAESTRVVVGQYLGFAAILGAAVVIAVGASFLPEDAIPYLGLLPLALGLRAAWNAWRSRQEPEEELGETNGGVSAWSVAAITLANAATTSASTYRSSPHPARAAPSSSSSSS